MIKRPLVAIDVGSSAVKVLELSGRNSKKLRAIGLETLPPGAIEDGMINEPEAVEEVLSELLKKLKISTFGRRAALGLGGSQVVIKRSIVTMDRNADIAEQVFYEAEQFFEDDMENIYYSYAELQRPNSKGEVPVMIVGAKRDMVEQYITTLHGVGLRTGVIECDAFSATNMFEFNYGVLEGLVAVINVGAAATQLSLVLNGEYIFARELAIAGEEYSRQIMEVLQVDHDNAETLKLAAANGDGSVPDDLHGVLSEANEQLVSEVHMAIDYFYQSGEFAGELGSLSSVYLTGGGSRALGLDAAMAATLQVPVQLVNPFQRVEVNPGRFQMDYILMQGHLYGVAVGLAMRMVDDT